MSEQSEEVELTFRLHEDVSPVGVFANFANVWHTPHDFTIDFATMPSTPPQQGDSHVEGLIVARVKMPTSVIFSLARAISENVNSYESSYGALTPPPPSD